MKKLKQQIRNCIDVDDWLMRGCTEPKKDLSPALGNATAHSDAHEKERRYSHQDLSAVNFFLERPEFKKIQDWHHISASEPARIYRFLDLVLRYYGGDGYDVMTLSDLPGDVAEAIRPYIMLVLKGDPCVKYEEDERIRGMKFVGLMNEISGVVRYH